MSIKFEFKTKKNKVRVILMSAATVAGIIMSLILFPELVLVYLFYGFFCIFTVEYKAKYSWPLDLVFPAVAALTTLYIDHLISMVDKSYYVDNGLSSVIMYLLDKGFMKVEIEIACVLGLYFVLRVCCVPRKVAAFVSTIPMLVLSVTNYYVYEFRGSCLMPLDIYAAETAVNVVDNYRFPIFVPLTVAVLPFVMMIVTFMHIKITSPKEKWYVREFMCTFLAFCSIYFGVTFFNQVLAIMPAYSFNYMGTIYNGYVTNFFLQVRDSKMKQPATYNVYRERISELSTSPDYVPEERPNVLVIMNESYCDVGIYADTWSDYYDPDPFLDSLPHGNAMSSVFGGMTPNSEFAFLTGIPTAFLPEGTTPYSMYIDRNMYSLANYFDEMGYNTCAMHPFHPNGWNRDNVYPKFGFDDFLSLADYPYEDEDLVRDYISDRYAYEYAVDYIEGLPEETPGFVFLVTMQNHGGYEYDERLSDHPVLHNAKTGEEDLEATTFFALINESDQALEYLIDRLSQSDEKYVVLMFGDHQPSAGFESHLGVGEDGWQIPYVVWTNYETDYVQSPELTSINYLSLDLLDAADLPMTDYYRYIARIRAEIPSINTVGFMMDGYWHPMVDADDVLILDDYRSLQYYYLFEM